MAVTGGERPADIEFGDELPEEDELGAAPAGSEEKAKGKKLPGWVFAAGGVVILLGLIGLVMAFINSRHKAAKAPEEIVNNMAVVQPPMPKPQPVIQQEPLPLKPSPGIAPAATPGAAPTSEPAAAPAMAKAPEAPQPQVQPQPQPQPQTKPAGEVGSVDGARLGALEKQVEQLSRQFAGLDKSLATVVEQMKALQSAKGTAAPAAPAKVASAAKPVAKPAVAKADSANPSATTPQQVASAGKAGEEDQPKKTRSRHRRGKAPAADPLAQKPAEAPQPYAGMYVTSIIGNRAWLTKKNPDGTETEVTVAPGERLPDGRTVETVDAQARSVILVGGAQISTRQ